MSRLSSWTLGKTAVVGVLTALAFLGTLVIRIPIPATTGYFNIGDTFVMLSGLWLGPVAGLIVGGIGPALADAIGFPQFILATSVTKGIEGLLVGLVAYQGDRETSVYRGVLAAGIGGVCIVTGYFLFEAFVYPYLGQFVPLFDVTDISMALTELLPNTGQAVISVILAVSLWKPLTTLTSNETANTG
jgi:uncharacterized membrane protein